MPGMYGSSCNKTCANNCKEALCHIQNGDCFTCKPGWTGTICNNKCTDGGYGLNCSQRCAGHCRDGITCNHVTGRCDRGCDAGWTGALCYNECPSGQFGLDCNERCSGHCMNNEPCDHASGVCRSGCRDGYTGSGCNNSCNEGFYGRNCSKICSPNCKICRRTDGLCACKAGWSGPRCTEECIQSFGENCQYPCNANCINRICDKFNGTCLFGCLNGRTCDLAGQQNAETDDDDISCTPWIIAFSIAMVIIIIFVIATIRPWRMSIKRNSNAGCVQSGRIPVFRETQVGLSDGISHYQELSVSKEHNTYQTLTL